MCWGGMLVRVLGRHARQRDLDMRGAVEEPCVECARMLMLSFGDFEVDVCLPEELRHVEEGLSDAELEDGARSVELA